MNSNLALQSYPDIDMCQELKVMDKPEYVDTATAAVIMDVAEETVRRLCREGKIDCKKLRRDWMVDKASAEAYEKSVGGSPSHKQTDL